MVNPRFSQDLGHSRTGSTSSDPRISGKHAVGVSREFISGSGGVDGGKPSAGQIPGPAGTHQQPPVVRSGAAEWQSKKDFGGRGEKRREAQSERPRERGSESLKESSHDRNRRETDRSDGRHTERSVERGSDRNREREYERSRSKEYERRRDSDSHRSRERERSLDCDARLRISNEKEYERKRESSRDKEYERDKSRDFVRTSSSQEKSDYGKDVDLRCGIQSVSSGDKDRHQVEGRSISEQEKKHGDGKSSKWSSLLDLPMPPPTLSQDATYSSNESRSSSTAVDEKFQNSREKLQRLFGIYGESSGTKEREVNVSKSRGWREEVRARKDLFFSQRSVQGSGDIDERVESHSQRHKIQQQREPIYGTSHNPPKSFPLQGDETREKMEQCKFGISNRSTSYNTEQPSDNSRPVRDTPLSPDQSPDNHFDSTDTPMSPDAEGSFSPTVSSEDTTPIKTIPLENIQQKGVDLEAIKKALARIQESERKSEASAGSNQGPSYRYEDFVGPALKRKPDEEEPYDPEEVWNNQELKTSVSDMSSPAAKPTSGDTDMRSLPKTVTSLPQSYQGKMVDKKADFPGSSSYSKSEVQSHNSGAPRSSAPASKSPQSQGSFEGQRSSNQTSVSDHTGTSGAAWYQSGPVSRPSSSSDVDMRFHQSKPSLPRHKPLTPKTQEPPARMLQSPTHQAPTLQSPSLPSSTLPQRSSLNRPPEDLSERERQSFPGSRLDSVRSRIAHKSGEFIKPGQQGVAASQMEKYKLKKQSVSAAESKLPSLNTSTKTDAGIKGKESVSVLDLLLPESKETKAEESSPSIRDPRQISQIPRDPRLKPPEPSEADALTSTVHARDPRLSGGGGVPRDPRHQTNRDPRQEISKFSSSLHREDLSRHYGASSSVKRDPRQDVGTVSHGALQLRDPRQDLLSVRGSRDIRQEPAQFPLMTGNQNRDPRDPRALPRGDRATSVWPQHQPPPVPTPSYSVQASPVISDPSPSQSASGSLIGQTFTCLMMRGLLPFINSNHIYRFFQEYILRDISIELDNNFQCKGTAYIHFPSHSSAREALELLNGHSLQGSPISLRICTVGILRQAKNAYENLNREREARLGIPERPRGNGNPFFKPRSREPLSKPSSKLVTGLPGKLSDRPEAAKNSTRGPVEGNEAAGNGQYSDLCGVKVPLKLTPSKSSFKIPKIKKDEPKQKDSTKDGNASTVEIQESKSTKTLVSKSSKESSDSEDDLRSVKAKNTKIRKSKKLVIASDSESGDEESESPRSNNEKRPGQITDSKKENTEHETKHVCDREAVTTDDDDAKNKSVSGRDAVSACDEESEDADGDEDYMVIDETVPLSETEESEVSSQMSEEPIDHASTSTEYKKKYKNNKNKRKKTGKQKLVKKSTSVKGKKKLQNNSSSGKKVRGKKAADKYMVDDAYKPELQLNSSIGMKLTRHTQGELEELIPEQKKLKVLIPVPLKIVTTICEDVKVKKGGRQKAVKNAQPNDNLKISVPDKIEHTPQALPVKGRKETGADKKSDGDNVILPIDGYWEYSAKYGSVGEMFHPVNTKLVVALRKEVAVSTPTARKGKKRQISCKTQKHLSKKQKCIVDSSRNQQNNLSDVDTSEAHGTSCRGAEKRSFVTPLQGNDSKRLCLERERQSGKSEGTSHFDLFETSMLSDDPDLTQITPSLLDVDPAISIALPNASALANVLSPPHASHSATENMHPKIGADSIWTTEKQPPLEGEKHDITKQLQSVSVKDLGDHVIEEDSVLEEMINIAIKTADTEESTPAMENKDKIPEEYKEGILGTEPSEKSKRDMNKNSEVSIVDPYINKQENECKRLLEESTVKDEVSDVTSFVKEENCKASGTDELPSNEKELRMQVEKNISGTKGITSVVRRECFKESETSETPMELPDNEKVLKEEKDTSFETSPIVNECGLPSVDKVSDNKQSSDQAFSISSEEATTCENISFKKEISDPEVANKLNKNFGLGIVTQEDTDDDGASIGRVSTSSFVDDASVVSSEGRDVKTPECQAPKRGRKSKTQTSLPSVECRRVTRGSVVEPLTAEHVEWDDGGIVDLFQCDQCDYVGRHYAHHLVNFHNDREMPCEFKKEDFPPVIKDFVGPPQEDIKETVSLDLSWIPNNMNFDENVTCKECDYCSRNRFDLIYHYLEHFPKARGSVYHCRLCNYMCEKKENFYNHVSSHTGEYRFRCELCGHWTYKKELLHRHHKDNHKSQSESFFEAPMIEDNGWLYIYVCKVCMFVRISIGEAEKHIQHKHSGRADIHKANMSRPIVLHSELRKPGSESESTLRPKYKGKKRKKGKKLPDLDVFLAEEEDNEKEMEEKAKQLVDRISSNIHTTMSVEDAKKRMSLLNSISKKLDEETEVESMEQEPGSKSKDEELPSVVPQSKSEQKEEPSIEPESEYKQEHPVVDETPSQTLETGSESSNAKGENSTDDNAQEKGNAREEVSIISDEKGLNNAPKILKDLESASTESDSESTISAIDPDAFEDDLIISGSGSLQDTIRKLSAKLEEVVKKKKVIQQSEEPQNTNESKEHTTTGHGAASGNANDNDSDSDTLVICEDADTDKEEEEEKLSDLSQTDQCSKESTSDAEAAVKSPSLQDSIQSILREASAQDKNRLSVPKLRIRPAHQLIEPHVFPKVRILKFFK